MASPTARVRVAAVDGASVLVEIQAIPRNSGIDDRPSFALRLALDAFERSLAGHFFAGESRLPCPREALAERARASPLYAEMQGLCGILYGEERLIDPAEWPGIAATGLRRDGTPWSGMSKDGAYYELIPGDYYAAEPLAPTYVRRLEVREPGARGPGTALLAVEYRDSDLADLLVEGLEWEIYF